MLSAFGNTLSIHATGGDFRRMEKCREQNLG